MRPPCFNTVFDRPLAGRGNPEVRSTTDYTSRSAFYCGVNVPAETGKMSRSDKRGATLPKVATVALLLRNDRLKSVIPKRS